MHWMGVEGEHLSARPFGLLLHLSTLDLPLLDWLVFLTSFQGKLLNSEQGIPKFETILCCIIFLFFGMFYQAYIYVIVEKTFWKWMQYQGYMSDYRSALKIAR